MSVERDKRDAMPNFRNKNVRFHAISINSLDDYRRFENSAVCEICIFHSSPDFFAFDEEFRHLRIKCSMTDFAQINSTEIVNGKDAM